MLRLTRNRKSRISDRLAIFAALILVVSSLAGAGNSVLSSIEGEVNLAAVNAAESAAVSLASGSSAAVKKNRNFKVSLFLFRNN